MPPGHARIIPADPNIDGGQATESRLSPEYFQREDEGDDSVFYESPRLVVHIDEGAIAAVGRLFKEQVPENSVVLDLMSSWRSHWPEGHAKQRMVGLGLNGIEMRENPDLDEFIMQYRKAGGEIDVTFFGEEYAGEGLLKDLSLPIAKETLELMTAFIYKHLSN